MCCPAFHLVYHASLDLNALSAKLNECTHLQVALAPCIVGYAEMSAKTAINQLKGLTVEQLATMRAYEAAHAGRVTVLREIDQQVKRVLAVE